MSENIAELHYKLVTDDPEKNIENGTDTANRKTRKDEPASDQPSPQVQAPEVSNQDQDPNNSWYSAVSSKNLWSTNSSTDSD